MLSPVKVSLKGLFQDSRPVTGYVTTELSHAGELGGELIVPFVQKHEFSTAGVTYFPLVPNAQTGENTYYKYTVVRTERISAVDTKEYVVLSGNMVVPEYDCNMLDIIVVPEFVPEPIEAAKMYASEAKEAAFRIENLLSTTEDSSAKAEAAAARAEEAARSSEASLALIESTSSEVLSREEALLTAAATAEDAAKSAKASEKLSIDAASAAMESEQRALSSATDADIYASRALAAEDMAKGYAANAAASAQIAKDYASGSGTSVEALSAKLEAAEARIRELEETASSLAVTNVIFAEIPE